MTFFLSLFMLAASVFFASAASAAEAADAPSGEPGGSYQIDIQSFSNARSSSIVIWPASVLSAKADWKPGEEPLALADGLAAWALRMAGHPAPGNFGLALARISSFLGVPATPENLMALAESLDRPHP
jgi:hypothetical protein